MNCFAQRFRPKASSADPLSPGQDARSTFGSSILLYRKIITQSRSGEERVRGGGLDHLT